MIRVSAVQGNHAEAASASLKDELGKARERGLSEDRHEPESECAWTETENLATVNAFGPLLDKSGHEI
jgi:hypothetical protein